MARETTKWPSTRWPITKIMSSDGCNGNRVPLEMGPWYDFREFGCHLGYVGLDAMTIAHLDRRNDPSLPVVPSPFSLTTDFVPAGDQPKAIDELVEGLARGERDQVLLGVTGSGKTFTMAQVIQKTGRPALILAPNKTLAAQLYGEMKSLFAENSAEYFVSYYDYYQPEAYVPRSDTYIEKESSINEQIDRMRHAATRAILV